MDMGGSSYGSSYRYEPSQRTNPPPCRASYAHPTPQQPPPSQRRNSAFSEATTLRGRDVYADVEDDKKKKKDEEEDVGESPEITGREKERKNWLKIAVNGIFEYWKKETFRAGTSSRACWRIEELKVQRRIMRASTMVRLKIFRFERELWKQPGLKWVSEIMVRGRLYTTLRLFWYRAACHTQ